VGVRCLNVLLSRGVNVTRVYTHADDPAENIWFGSVEALARAHGIAVSIVTRADDPALPASVAAESPDFLFSFYYRFMLAPAVLSLATRGAYNLHGSLLPKYRGRVPVNWAIIHGEHETGATLHEMTAKPDAGGILAQQAVPILVNDTALDVFRKTTVAAEIALYGVLPSLLAGTAKAAPQNLAAGSYFSGRKPDDGRIDFTWSAAKIHNLVRAVAPPYPGAFADVNGRRLALLGTLRGVVPSRAPGAPTLLAEADALFLQCVDGEVLRVTSAQWDGQALTASSLRQINATGKLALV
jgi:methionyl-tRNA formyltransferase